MDFELIEQQIKSGEKLKQICNDLGYPYDKTRVYLSRYRKKQKENKGHIDPKVWLDKPQRNKGSNVSKLKSVTKNVSKIPTFNETYQYIQDKNNHVHHDYFTRKIKRNKGEIELIIDNQSILSKYLDVVREMVN